jgi:hypothetical protein
MMDLHPESGTKHSKQLLHPSRWPSEACRGFHNQQPTLPTSELLATMPSQAQMIVYLIYDSEH